MERMVTWYSFEFLGSGSLFIIKDLKWLTWIFLYFVEKISRAYSMYLVRCSAQYSSVAYTIPLQLCRMSAQKELFYTEKDLQECMHLGLMHSLRYNSKCHVLYLTVHYITDVDNEIFYFFFGF